MNALKEFIIGLIAKIWAHISAFFVADSDGKARERRRANSRVVYHFDYERDGAISIRRIVWAQWIVIALLLAVFPFYLSLHKIENRFFPTTLEGRLIPDVALREQNIGAANLVSWLSQAASSSLSLGYHDYTRRLRQSSQYFTRKGWADFTEFMNDQRIFRRIKRNKSLITTEPTTAPIIQDQGVYIDSDGVERYFWQMKLNVRMTFREGQSDTITLPIQVRIVRVPKLESGMGISIDQWRIDR